jgi:uncharacterized protein involved in outer membrane biogenesis
MRAALWSLTAIVLLAAVSPRARAPITIDLATAKEVRFGLALAPLLSGKVQVTEVALIQPIVD